MSLDEQEDPLSDCLEHSAKMAKEIKTLKEQLARMGEALKFLTSQILINDFIDGQGHRAENLQAMEQAINALSSYDPKWIEGVRAEAEVQGGREGLLIGFREAVDYFWNKLPNDHSVWENITSRDAVLMRLVNDTKSYSPEEDKSRQPNQSREKRG